MGCLALPAKFATHTIQLVVGAGSHTLTPAHDAAGVQISVEDRYYVAYRSGPPSDYAMLRRFGGPEGPSDHSIDCDALIAVTNIPPGDVYGVPFRTDLRFDIWSNTPIQASDLLEDLAKSPAKTSIANFLLASISQKKQESVAALSRRKATLTNRRKLYLNTIPQRFIGYEPTNET